MNDELEKREAGRRHRGIKAYRDTPREQRPWERGGSLHLFTKEALELISWLENTGMRTNPKQNW